MREFLRKLGWLKQRRQKDADLQEELEFHLAAEAKERVAAGATQERARYAAQRELGNATLIAEETRESWGWPALERPFKICGTPCECSFEPPASPAPLY